MDIILRASAVFFILFLIIRGLGKRQLAQITPFEFLMLVLIGDLAQQGITQSDASVTGAALAAGTIAFWVMVLAWIDFRLPSSRPLLEGRPVVVVHDGRMLDDMLRSERIPVDELLAAARQHGIEDLRRVRWGILEVDGKFSFIEA
jgi:uncharacterized membrane protein YcaP (DUF421 family)